MESLSLARLSEITQNLDALAIPWGIFAGAAAKIYGSPRHLKDIDILIPSNLGECVSRCFPEAEVEFRKDQSVASVHLPEVEIIAGLTKGISLEMDNEMIARISRHKLMGIDLPVLSLEDNLVFKAVLNRGPDVGKNDWGDITAMLKKQSNVDWVYIYFRFEKCGSKNPSSIITRLKMICGKK